MTYTGTFSTPQMEINGALTNITPEIWAKKTLSAENYALFIAARQREDALWDAAMAAGTVVRTPTPDGIQVTMTETVASDAEYADFMTQMLNDPAVTWPGPGIKPIY